MVFATTSLYLDEARIQRGGCEKDEVTPLDVIHVGIQMPETQKSWGKRGTHMHP